MTATETKVENKKTAMIAQLMKAGLSQTAAEDMVEDLADTLCVAARQEGKDDLLADLWDAGEIAEDGVEFAVENNSAADPRK